MLIGRASPLGKLWEAVFGSPLVFTWKAAVVAALLHALPLLVKSARAALESVDRSYERAARNLGASELKLFWRVTLPLARRSILAATALAFARSLGRFRRHADGGGQYSRAHADRGRGDLRRRGIGQRRGGARAGAGGFGGGAADPDAGEPPDARRSPRV